jgi:membrane associated rhomboid family serine protease
VASRYDSSQVQIRLPPFTPAVRALIIANVAVQVLQFLAGPEATFKLQDLFALDPVRVLRQMWLWQPVTYMFLHHPGDIWHLVFNMLTLWMFGGDIESRWGAARFTRYYFICGIGAGFLTCAANILRSEPSATIGASGAIFGLLLAYAMLFPHRITLFMGLFPMPARVMVGLFAVLQLYFVGAFSRSGVAYFAHLGGMLVGWLYLTGWWDPRKWIAETKWKVRRRRFKAMERRREEEEERQSYRFH